MIDKETKAKSIPFLGRARGRKLCSVYFATLHNVKKSRANSAKNEGERFC